MKLKIILTSLILFFSFSCSNSDDVQDICIDESKIDELGLCIEIYQPVCGCDGITYPNDCYADRLGVISYVAGECCD